MRARKTSPPTPEELSAWLDGELEPERQVAISYYLSTRPAEAAEVTADRAIADGLRTLSGRGAPGDVPAEALRALAGLRRRERPVTRYAALGLAAALALAAVIFVFRPVEREPAPVAAVSADVLYFLDVGPRSVEFAPGDSRSMREILPGFDPAYSVNPRLSAAGFRLIGGRALARNGRGALLLFYEDVEQALLGLLIREAGAAFPADIHRAGVEAPVLTWSDGLYSYTLTARREPAVLDAFAAAWRSPLGR